MTEIDLNTPRGKWIESEKFRYRILPASDVTEKMPPAAEPKPVVTDLKDDGGLPAALPWPVPVPVPAPPSPPAPTANGTGVPCVIRAERGTQNPPYPIVTKVDSTQSGGACTVFHITVQPRRGSLRHSHKTRHAVLYVVQGKFRVVIDDHEYDLNPGDIGNFPMAVKHSFHNISDAPAIALLTCAPAGLENFFLKAPPMGRGTPGYMELARTYDIQESGNDLIVNKAGMRMVKIPAGEFMMGSADSEATGDYAQIMSPGNDEKPRHKVRISKRFAMGMYPVTLGQFSKFVAATNYQPASELNGAVGIDLQTGFVELKPEYTWRKPWHTPGTGIAYTDDHPVVAITYEDANKFCQWLTAEDSEPGCARTYRLPTEAEWEMACRAGSTTRFFFGDDYRQLQQYANVADKSLQQVWIQREQSPVLPIPVGTPLPPYAMPWDDKWPFPAIAGKFQPNNWGLYDMHGNVGEWCTDWYDPGYYARSPVVDPAGPAEADAPEIDVSFIPGLSAAIPKKRKLRVIRGGVWLDPVVAMRSADRRNHVRHPVDAAADIGFRVVMEWNDKDWDPFEPEMA